MALILGAFVRAQLRRYVLWLGTTLAAVAALRHFVNLDPSLAYALPPLVAYLCVVVSAQDDFAGNLGWLLGLPVSRRTLWMSSYAMNLFRLGLVVLACAGAVLVVTQFGAAAGQAVPEVGRHESVARDSVRAVGIFGGRRVPYLIVLALFVHCLLSKVPRRPVPLSSFGVALAHLRREPIIWFVLAVFAGLCLSPRTAPFLAINYGGVVIWLTWAAARAAAQVLPPNARSGIYRFNFLLAILALAFGLASIGAPPPGA